MSSDAWDILNKDEKLSITLSLGHNKSSWEAGEIVGKSHYKYLEINSRAERFLRMFTEHFQLFGDLIPKKNNMTRDFQDYLIMLVKERKSMKETISRIEGDKYHFTGAREVVLEEAMLALKNSDIKGERELFDLLLEFDRWNNFRILPRKFQQPSAFKRRNKGRELKHLKSITDLPFYSVKKIKEKFAYNGRDGVYFTMVSSKVPNKFIVVKMHNKAKEISQISQLGFFIFKDQMDAMTLGQMAVQYLFPMVVIGFSPVIKGLKFWTPYRELIAKSVNYGKVYNLVPNRKYVEDALIEQQLKREKIKGYKPEN